MILRKIKYVYFIFCLLATIGLSIYSIYRFWLNEDTTVVQVTRFLSSMDAIYPSLSFCVLPPFLEEKFDIYEDEKINMSSYRKFLEGEFWDERMLSIEYDNVTVSLEENLIKSMYKTHSKNFGVMDWKAEYFVSFRSPQRKCFTIKAPFPDEGLLHHSWLKIKKEIFPVGKRADDKKLYTYIHYPGQRFTGYYTWKSHFDPRHNQTKNYKIVFKIHNIDVITRRNKLRQPCLKDTENYDHHFMQIWMQEVGCRPPQWKFENSKLPLCSNANQMKEFRNQPDIMYVESFDPPCRTIAQLDYFYHKKNLERQG